MRVGLLAFVAACYAPSKPESCVLSCDDVTPCPGGLTCVAGLCEAAGQPCSTGDASVGDDAPPSFTVADCPADYSTQIALTATSSRYRLLGTLATFYQHVDSCESHSAGLTHLAVATNSTELTQLRTALSLSTDVWVGAAQYHAAATTSGSWLWFNGANMTGGWRTSYPNDGGDNLEADHEAQSALYGGSFDAIVDAPGTSANGALCECDGIATNTTARMYVDRDPLNPN